MRPRLLLLLLAALVGMVGCSRPPEDAGKLRELSVTSLVSLSPSTTEIACQLGLQGRLKGRTSSCNYPPSLGAVPIVVNGTKPDFERIKSYKPSLILYDETLYGDADVAKIKELGIATLPLSPTSLEKVFDYYAELGMMVGNEQGASDFIDRLFAARESSISNMAGKEVSATVLLGGGAEYMAAGSETYVADSVRAAGGKYLGPEGKLFVTINPEELIRLNPEVIFTPAGGEAKLLSDPRFASIAAVKNKRVYPTDGDVLLRPGSRIDKLIQAMNAVFVAVPEAVAAP